MALTEAKKRDFIIHVLTTLESNIDTLSDNGFNAEAKLTELKTDKEASDKSENYQIDAVAVARKAQEDANIKLDKAYKNASAIMDLLSGTLGKNSPLVKELRKRRK